MSTLGVVAQEDNQFVAKIATYDLGKRYRFAGPLRGDDERLAYQDLCYIRAAADGAPSHVDGLCAMQTAAKLLRDEAKALARGRIKQDASGSWFARFKYVDCGITNKEILGPPRQSERRAENDLATLREAARAQKTWPEQVAAMQQAAQVLRESAQLENRVARGVAQYEAQKQAHKAEDSDPETSGDEDDGADDHYYGLDEAAIAKMIESIPPQRAPPPPPVDANDANVQLALFLANSEKPETLEAILRANADPNLIVDDDISPLRKVIALARNHDVVRMRELLLEHGAFESAFERQRWEERQRADANDAAWLKNFHRSEQSATDRLCLCPYPRLYSYFL